MTEILKISLFLITFTNSMVIPNKNQELKKTNQSVERTLTNKEFIECLA